MTLSEMVAMESPFLQGWILWLSAINILSLLFIFTRQEARWIFGVFLANILFMSLLYEIFGYVRILGLSHIIFWTPLLAYLVIRLRNTPIPLQSPFGAYLILLLGTNGISLLFDYRDFILWLTGDQAIML